MREVAKILPLERLGVHLLYSKIALQVLSQKKVDSNKVYISHEPDVKCNVIGNDHKKIKFGSKASIMVHQSSGIIVGAINFTESLHDSKAITEAREQYHTLTEEQLKDVFADRGYRVKVNITQLK